MEPYQPTEDLLLLEETYERASMGKRLVNYLIDIALYYILMIALGILLILITPNLNVEALEDDDFISIILSLVLYALYMGSTEALFKGKTLGKLITRTRAVQWDGSPLTTGKAFARGFSRAVPFCVFSALGTPSNPWQDRWTNTMVVNDQKKI